PEKHPLATTINRIAESGTCGCCFTSEEPAVEWTGFKLGRNSRRARTEASRDFTRKAHNASHRPASCDAGPCNGGFMIGKILCSGLATVAAILLLAGGENAQAQPAAQHSKVVIQVSDGDQAKWNLALNNARNIQADLGAANVDIEIVAYGPGIGMLK